MSEQDPVELARDYLARTSRISSGDIDAARTLARAVLDYEATMETLHEERDEARANFRWMVEHAADEKLDGYRELGAKAAKAEQERDDARAEVEQLRAALGMDRPWPITTTLPKLIEAGEILLRVMDYDGHGWEQIDHAIESAKQIIAALTPPAKEVDDE
jgi:hypothetical protein